MSQGEDGAPAAGTPWKVGFRYVLKDSNGNKIREGSVAVDVVNLSAARQDALADLVNVAVNAINSKSQPGRSMNMNKAKIGESIHYREGETCRAAVVLSYCKIQLPKRDEYGNSLQDSGGKLVYEDHDGVEAEVIGGGYKRTLLPGSAKAGERYHLQVECEG